jgi:hypothetical protein
MNAYMDRAAAGGITLVEQQVDHGRNGADSLRSLGRARHLEGNICLRHAALRPGDALLHRGLADQEGARNLLEREAGNDAQRERDLLGRRQIGMAADEQEAQHVVAIVRIIEPLGEVSFGIAQIRDDLVRGQRLALALPADVVESEVPPDQDEPGGRIARRSVDRPVLQRAQTGFLKGLLGLIEVAEIAQQRANRLGTRGSERGIDPGDGGHVARLPGLNRRSGRISNAPPDSPPFSSRAVSMASSSDVQSTT